MTTYQMLPCPFCSWENICFIEDKMKVGLLKKSKYGFCWCKICGCRGPCEFSTGNDMEALVKKCIDRWNERGVLKSE